MSTLKFDVLDLIREPDNYLPGERAKAAEVICQAKQAGTLLANIAYNLAQDESLSDSTRWSLDDARKRWDDVVARFGGAE